ncbi:MAG: hypothetical protein WCG14_00415 [Chlamydiia bacterium]
MTSINPLNAKTLLFTGVLLAGIGLGLTKLYQSHYPPLDKLPATQWNRVDSWTRIWTTANELTLQTQLQGYLDNSSSCSQIMIDTQNSPSFAVKKLLNAIDSKLSTPGGFPNLQQIRVVNAQAIKDSMPYLIEGITKLDTKDAILHQAQSQASGLLSSLMHIYITPQSRLQWAWNRQLSQITKELSTSLSQRVANENATFDCTLNTPFQQPLEPTPEPVVVFAEIVENHYGNDQAEDPAIKVAPVAYPITGKGASSTDDESILVAHLDEPAAAHMPGFSNIDSHIRDLEIDTQLRAIDPKLTRTLFYQSILHATRPLYHEVRHPSLLTRMTTRGSHDPYRVQHYFSGAPKLTKISVDTFDPKTRNTLITAQVQKLLPKMQNIYRAGTIPTDSLPETCYSFVKTKIPGQERASWL